MKSKKVIAFSIATVFMFSCLVACSGKNDKQQGGITEQEQSDTTVNEPQAELAQTKEAKQELVIQPGPYGEISVKLSDGWKYELADIDSGKIDYGPAGQYGIRFYPENAKEGYIDLFYIDVFGVCGTELEEENITLAGVEAQKGTYDNDDYWSFIIFKGEKERLVAIANQVDDWSKEDMAQAEQILDTLEWDTNKKTGCAFIDSSESYNDKLGVYFSLKNITATGATMVVQQYDSDVKDEISYSEYYKLEIEKSGKWEEATTVADDYAFSDIAYILDKDSTVEEQISWENIYGELMPGNYRIIKQFNGDELKAYFVVNF